MSMFNLQRSYKYMMYSTKQRINQADLKCKSKNGCGYYGNPDWEGMTNSKLLNISCYHLTNNDCQMTNIRPNLLFDY